jgi:hypothetical protein
MMMESELQQANSKYTSLQQQLQTNSLAHQQELVNLRFINFFVSSLSFTLIHKEKLASERSMLESSIRGL